MGWSVGTTQASFQRLIDLSTRIVSAVDFRVSTLKFPLFNEPVEELCKFRITLQLLSLLFLRTMGGKMEIFLKYFSRRCIFYGASCDLVATGSLKNFHKAKDWRIVHKEAPFSSAFLPEEDFVSTCQFHQATENCRAQSLSINDRLTGQPPIQANIIFSTSVTLTHELLNLHLKTPGPPQKNYNSI